VCKAASWPGRSLAAGLVGISPAPETRMRGIFFTPLLALSLSRPDSVFVLAAPPSKTLANGASWRGQALGWRKRGTAGLTLRSATADPSMDTARCSSEGVGQRLAVMRGGGMTGAGIPPPGSGTNGRCRHELKSGAKRARVADKRQAVLVLDVDGTLYPAASGIEQQIVRGIHRFATSRFKLDPAESDKLHREYGSTLEGLKKVRNVPEGCCMDAIFMTDGRRRRTGWMRSRSAPTTAKSSLGCVDPRRKPALNRAQACQWVTLLLTGRLRCAAGAAGSRG